MVHGRSEASALKGSAIALLQSCAILALKLTPHGETHEQLFQLPLARENLRATATDSSQNISGLSQRNNKQNAKDKAALPDKAEVDTREITQAVAQSQTAPPPIHC